MSKQLKHALTLGGIGFVGVMALPMAAQAQEACGAYPKDQGTYTCTCAAGTGGGTVWGSGPYTADSDLCQAARHAGAIDRNGGKILVARSEGLSGYTGSSQNGVTTQSWGAYDTSVEILRGKANARGDVAICGSFDAAQSPMTCACGPNSGGGSVWGSGPFTADSDICTAAKFEGVIDAQGGSVTVLAVEGLQSYFGQSANGVTTQSWGAYQQSFTFNWN